MPPCTQAVSDDCVITRITKYQLPIYPDVNMMKLTSAGIVELRFADETGGSFGNDRAPIQRFPVCDCRRTITS